MGKNLFYKGTYNNATRMMLPTWHYPRSQYRFKFNNRDTHQNNVHERCSSLSIVEFIGNKKYVCVSGGKKCLFFWKIWCTLFSCNTRFEIHPFALLTTNSNKPEVKRHMSKWMLFCFFFNLLVDLSQPDSCFEIGIAVF